MALLLASASPQRRAILEQLGFPFRVVAPDVVELEQGDPEHVARENSRRKAAAVRAVVRPDECVVAVDTIVVLDGAVYGKPADETSARSMLRSLRGRSHTVLGGLTFAVDGEPCSLTAATQVRFREVSDDVLETYLAGGEWRERAGGYAIQGTGAAFVAEITGDYLNVVGFPMAAFLDLLDERALRERAFANASPADRSSRSDLR